MALVQCVKCSQEREGMANPPFRPGTKLAELGAEVQNKVCAACYKDWIAMSVKLVNELRLDTTDPRGQQLWLDQMKSFLNLAGGAADPWARFLDKRVAVETVDGSKVEATLIGLDADKLNLAEFAGGTIPSAFTPSTTGAKGSATIARDKVRIVEAAG